MGLETEKCSHFHTQLIEKELKDECVKLNVYKKKTLQFYEVGAIITVVLSLYSSFLHQTEF